MGSQDVKNHTWARCEPEGRHSGVVRSIVTEAEERGRGCFIPAYRLVLPTPQLVHISTAATATARSSALSSPGFHAVWSRLIFGLPSLMPVLVTPYGHTLSYFFLSLTKFQFLSLRTFLYSLLYYKYICVIPTYICIFRILALKRVKLVQPNSFNVV